MRSKHGVTSLLFEPVHPLIQARAGRARDIQDLHAGVHFTRICLRLVGIKRHVWKQVDLVQDHQLRFEEDGRILERLVLTLRHTEHHDFESLSQVITSRTYQVPNVLYDQGVEISEIPFGEMLLDHAGVQVTRSACNDLTHRKTESRQAGCVILGLQVASQQRDLRVFRQALQRALQQRCLTRARRADDVEAENSMLAELRAQPLRNDLVFVQHLLFNLNLTHGSSTSRYAISNSSPAIVTVNISSHFGQAVMKSGASNSN